MPFGAIWSLPVCAVQNNLRFTGQYLDGETGLYQNGFRDYSAPVGRYREPDGLSFMIGVPSNIYAYVDGRPTLVGAHRET